MRFVATLLAICVLAPAAALAGDCSVVPPAVAKKAVSYLKKGVRMAPYCKTCGTPMPGTSNIYTVTKATVGQPVGMSPTATPNKTVWITLKGVSGAQWSDLRGTYVETKAKSGVFNNLGKLAGCASREPASIKIK